MNFIFPRVLCGLALAIPSTLGCLPPFNVEGPLPTEDHLLDPGAFDDVTEPDGSDPQDEGADGLVRPAQDHDTSAPLVADGGVSDAGEGHVPDELLPDVDELPPEVIATAPVHLTVDVRPDVELGFHFSNPMDQASVQAAFSMVPLVAGTFDWAEDGRMVFYVPAADLAPNTTYTFSLGPAATDAGGHPVVDQMAITFETGEPIDREPPVVLDTTPSDGNLVASVDSLIEIEFDEPMDTATTLLLLAPTTAGTTTWSNGDTLLSFTPDAPLPYETQFSASISSGAADVEGNLVGPEMWSFVTEVAPASLGGGLDPNFGEGGVAVLVDLAADPLATGVVQDSTLAMVVDDKRRTVVAGIRDGSTLVLARLDRYGELDTSFGTGGVLDLGSYCIPENMRTDGGNIWLVGGCGGVLTLARIDELGQDVRVFSADALPGDENGYDVELGIDGYLYVTGTGDVTGSGAWDFALWRFTLNGATAELDPSFGQGGVWTHDDAAGGTTLTGFNRPEQGLHVRLAGERMWVAGNASAAASDDHTIWSFHLDGSLDTSFQGQGWAVVSAPTFDSYDLQGFVIDDEGRFITAGRTSWPAWNFVTYRLTAEGDVDPSYGDNGEAEHTNITGASGLQEIHALAVDHQGRVLAVGEGSVPGSSSHDLVLARFDENGSRDTSFGDDGVVTFTETVGSGTWAGVAVAVDEDGNIVVAGHGGLAGTSSYDAMVWRFEPGL